MRALEVSSPSGGRYRLATDGIVDYEATEDGRICLVQMSRGANPVGVIATLQELDEIYAEIMYSPLPDGYLSE